MPKYCLLAVAAIFLALGCSKKSEVRKEMMVQGPIVLPNEMCAQHGTVAMSNDKEGDRMVCELQNQLGTHIPRCICVDEGFSERDQSQVWVRACWVRDALHETVTTPGRSPGRSPPASGTQSSAPAPRRFCSDESRRASAERCSMPQRSARSKSK